MLASLVVIVRKVMDQHLFLNIIPKNVTARIGWEHWCDHALITPNWKCIFVGDYHGGHHLPTYMTKPKMIITCTTMSKFGCASDVWDPPTKTYGMSTCPSFVAPQLFLIVGGGKATRRATLHHNKDVEQTEMLVWTTWHPILVALPTIWHLEVDENLAW